MARLTAELLSVVQFVDASKTLTSQDDIQFTMDSLLHKFYHLKFAEWLIVFDKMKRGEFGTYYNRLKCAEFMEAFDLYDSEEWRGDYFANVNKTKQIDTAESINYGKVVSKFKERMAEEKSRQTDTTYDGIKVEYQTNGTIIGAKDV